MIVQICFDYTFKAYTMHGTFEEPGLIPRSMKVLFNTIQGKLLGMTIKPDSQSYSGVKVLTDSEKQKHIKHKNTVLSSFDGEVC